MRRILLTCAAAVAMAAPASAQYVYGYSGSIQQLVLNGGAYTLNTLDQGWYNGASHDTYNTNYIVADFGGSVYNNFFTFDLSGLPTITSAALRLNTEVVSGNYTVQFNDYVGNQTALINGTGGLAAFTDLANGKLYASQGYTGADNYTTKTINLNSFAIADLNAANGRMWTVGGTLAPGATVTPEPTSMVLLGSGLAGVLARRRRRKADAAA